MNRPATRTQVACLRVLFIPSLLATFHCNAVLGIHEATCIDGCHDAGAAAIEEESAGAIALDAGSSSPDGSAPPRSEPPDDVVPRVPENAVTGAQDTPLVDDVVPPAPDLEDVIAATCAEQTAGEPFCLVNHRVMCGADGAVSIAVCTDADDCLRGTGSACASASCDAEDGCVAPVCTPGERRCRGEKLEVCNAEGRKFVLHERCERGTSCNPDEGCVAASCEADDRRCREDD